MRLSKRICEDETPIHANEAPHKGRSRNLKPIIRARSRYATKYTLHVYAKKDRGALGLVRQETQTLRRSSVSQWMQPHRWTRAIHFSGTVWVGVDEHYILFTSTTAQLCERSSRNVACQMKFLPPKGKYFNPIELLFNDLKSHHIRPNFPQNGQNLSKPKIRALVRSYTG